MTINLLTALAGTMFPAGPQGVPGATGPIGQQGAQGPAGANGARGPVGPPAWATLIPWTPGLNCSAVAPSTIVSFQEAIYVCTTSHIAGGSFNPIFWQFVCGSPSGGFFAEMLTVTATDTLSPLSLTYAGIFALLVVRGQLFMPVGSPPPFTVGGTTVSWNASAAGLDIQPGDAVAILYSK